MLLHIVFKNFKSNLRNYLLFFFSEILSVALIFSFYAMQATLYDWAKQGITDVYMYIAVKLTGIIVVIVGVVVVAFSMKYYARARFRDYSLFLTLGMRQRMIRKIIAAEYLFGWIFSFAAGILLGNGIQVLFKTAVKRYYGNRQVSLAVPAEVYKNTLLISGIMIIGVMIVIAILLEERGISNLVAMESKKEGRPVKKEWGVLVIAGILLFAVSVLELKRFGVNFLNENGIYSLAGCIAAGGILLLFGGGLFLERLKRNETYYYKNIISVNQLYHRFFSNTLMIFAVFALQLLTITYLAVGIADHLPVNPSSSLYPYDFQWFGEQKDQEYASQFAEKYKGTVEALPVVRATLQWGGENIGISESTYEEVVGEKLKKPLEGQEVYCINQHPAKERVMLEFSKKGKIQGDIHIGKVTQKMMDMLLWDEQWGDYFKEGYAVTGYEQRSLFGYFAKSKSCEDVYVFSDEFFGQEWERICQEEGEPSMMYCFNVPKQAEPKAKEELKDYVEKNGIQTLEESYVFYAASDARSEKKMENIMYIMVNLFLIFTLFISSIFVIGMKTLAEFPYYQEKYQFLRCMGMPEKERRRTLCRELMEILKLPVLLSYSFGIIFVLRLFQVRGTKGMEAAVFISNWAAVIVIYLIIQILSVFLMQRYLVNKVEGKDQV